MMKRVRIQVTLLLLAAIVASVSPSLARAASRQELARDAAQALQSLYAKNTAARMLGGKARPFSPSRTSSRPASCSAGRWVTASS